MTQIGENARRIVHLLPAKPAALTGTAEVLRALPRREQRRVGSFVFFDHFGPHETASGAMDVPPHPHVGLQTVTYLFSGAIEHRDSLKLVDSDEDVLSIVESLPGAVGLVEVRSVTDRVKIVHVDGKLPMEDGYLPH